MVEGILRLRRVCRHWRSEMALCGQGKGNEGGRTFFWFGLAGEGYTTWRWQGARKTFLIW